MSIRVTGPLIKVLRALMSEPNAERYGLEIMRATRVKSGTLYPLLDRLEDEGMLESRWEDESEPTSGGPRRRFYRLTGLGVSEAQRIIFEYVASELPAWA